MTRGEGLVDGQRLPSFFIPLGAGPPKGMKNAKDLGFVSGRGFIGCGKLCRLKGTGFSPYVRKGLETGPTLAAEGTSPSQKSGLSLGMS
jgi:hypothetical protein